MSATKNERNIMAVLEQAGYSNAQKLTETLQGSIWTSYSTKTAKNKAVIVKVTSRKLHKESMIIYEGKKYNVEENIIKEKEILKYLTCKSSQDGTTAPIESETDGSNTEKKTPCTATTTSSASKEAKKNVVKYVDFFKSNSNFYFVMENGGHMLFDFVVRVHRYIESGKLDIAEWHDFVKVIFPQICHAVRFIHDKHVCHHDISLENLLINDIEVVLDADGKIRFCHDNVRIKLCDFGLAEQYISNDKYDASNINYQSSKFCGKPNYKSPECTSKKPFDAQKNDIWCVGVSLFMMLIGGNMVSNASDDDESFVEIIAGKIEQLLQTWNRALYVDEQIISLLQSIFKFEAKRASLQQIIDHPWLQ
mmetsp:Transcript_15629/g.23876  ORF Transcript_15629/g.23876 Transcript_15629/m.23876 type:complete len:364 (-) Transcript_15629:1258-2349(-)|eukprot:CAMPEP_0202732718 /NCGR_PEP_ID=MMETSP1385-20130828/187802_1 /ASSEMBLY_ACC=CAM_ASM_000861 /TAXON_ID=933848 /ORGANISM="Elphidium margaritaceum" /LENGTH=363 /DNA_ID=CAMNT_0049399041 /DNA_START=165 /DNA_END=1256 /DNA_ORIENTATION=-